MNIRYDCDFGIAFDNPADEHLDHLLGELNDVDNSYASLMTSDGCYLQAGGGPTPFTVEERRYKPGGTSCHLSAVQAGRVSEECTKVVGVRLYLSEQTKVSICLRSKIYSALSFTALIPCRGSFGMTSPQCSLLSQKRFSLPDLVGL